MMEGLRLKYAQSSTQDQYRVLTSLPPSTSVYSMKKDFDCGFSRAQKAKELQRSKGRSTMKF